MFKASYHCCVQLFLNGLIYILAVLLWVVHREGIGEKQSGVCTHLKVRNLNESQMLNLNTIWGKWYECSNKLYPHT